MPSKLSLSSFPIAMTASTTISAKNSFSPPINFDDNVVAAHFANKDFFSSRLFPSMLTASSLTLLIACYKILVLNSHGKEIQPVLYTETNMLTKLPAAL